MFGLKTQTDIDRQLFLAFHPCGRTRFTRQPIRLRARHVKLIIGSCSSSLKSFVDPANLLAAFGLNVNKLCPSHSSVRRLVPLEVDLLELLPP